MELDNMKKMEMMMGLRLVQMSTWFPCPFAAVLDSCRLLLFEQLERIPSERNDL